MPLADPDRVPGRRIALCAMAALMAAVMAAPLAAQPSVHRTIGWDDLVPAGWDPMLGLRDLPADLDTLQDGDPRARAAMERLRAAWDHAPTVPALHGADVKLPGYVVPLEAGRQGVREFLLVPYLGACIHSPPPPANQILLVRAELPVPGLRTMEAVWAWGRLAVGSTGSVHGVAGYAMHLARVEKQKG